MTFEENLARLEAIVGELDGEGVELDRGLRLFEEGIEHLRAAVAELTRAEAKVQMLSETANGVLEMTELRA